MSSINFLITYCFVALIISFIGQNLSFGFSLALLICLYMLPAYISQSRGHPNQGVITNMNILLGWTIIFWIIALFQSIGYIDPAQRVNRITDDLAPEINSVKNLISRFLSFNYKASKAFLKSWRKSFDYLGREDRSTFWNFYYFLILTLIVPPSIGILENSSLNFLYSSYIAFTFLPYSAICARRLRDIGLNLYWLILLLTPYLGILIVCPLLLSKPSISDSQSLAKS